MRPCAAAAARLYLALLMNPSTQARAERLLSNFALLRAALLLLGVLGTWMWWTYWTNAFWIHQVIFLIITISLTMVVWRPRWFLNLLLFVYLVDVTGQTTGTQIPGFIGIGGIAGNAKIGELMTVAAVAQIAMYFCLRPSEFRRPLVGNVLLVVLTGAIAMALGAKRYIATNAFRDSLACYFVVFYIIAVVLLPSLRFALSTFRTIYYTACIAVITMYILTIIERSTSAFYSSTYGMVYSSITYLLLAKIATSPKGARRWLSGLMIVLFVTGIFIGRARGPFFAFFIGLIPLLIALPWNIKFSFGVGAVAPALVLMLALLTYRPTRIGSDLEDVGERRIESFTKIGNFEYDQTGSYRLTLWGMAWDGFMENPLLGKGYGWLLPIRSGDILENNMPASNVHNSYMHILACSGLLGFVPLLVLVIRFFRIVGHEMRTSTSRIKRIWAAAALGVGLNALVTPLTNVTLENLSAILVWVLVALALRLALASEKELQTVIPYRMVWNAAPADKIAYEQRFR